MAELKAGVIGLGMGWGHLAGYMAHPDVVVAAVADASPERRERAAREFPGRIGRIYDDGMEMIRKEKLDILSVAVPNVLHRTFTVAGLEAGANVLCEKPMAMNAAEAEEMLETARRCKRKLGINFSYRFFPQSRAMKRLTDSGVLGEIYYARSEWMRRDGIPQLPPDGFDAPGSAPGGWFFDKKQAGGGPLIDLGVHRLDLALWLMGYPEPAWVMGGTYAKFGPARARSRGRTYSVEDMACAMIRFANGATLELDVSWAAHIRERELQTTRLIGTDGGLLQRNVNEGYTYELEWYRGDNGLPMDCRLHDPAPEAASAYALFADAVRDGTEFLVRPEEGVTVMRILDAVYRSAETGRPVEMGSASRA